MVPCVQQRGLTQSSVVVLHASTQVSAFLSANSIPNHVYHKNLPPKDQAAALEAMAHPAPEHNLVMVSTDAAARGIDLPQVTHVIQADFVANAIEFLHRVGRTARAGRSGKVTSLYTPAGKVLMYNTTFVRRIGGVETEGAAYGNLALMCGP
jgi:superfamily II DNA/RNA helicase